MTCLPRSRAPRPAGGPSLGPGVIGVLLLTGALLGCGVLRSDAPSDPTGEARAARIAALEARVETDREALAEMVTRPRDIDVEPLHEDAALREIAERLRRDTRELERLRAQPTGEAS